MKGYRFYEEFDSSYKKRQRQGTGNVLALDVDWRGRPFHNGVGLECCAALLSEPNSPVCGTEVSRNVLRRNYRRVTEQRARQIHPAMFDFLDQFDEHGVPKLPIVREVAK
jgi:hypothetical protein